MRKSVEQEPEKKSKGGRNETHNERLIRVLLKVKTRDSYSVENYMRTISTDDGLEQLIKDYKCPLIINYQDGICHLVFRPSPSTSRRGYEQQITDIGSLANKPENRYISHSTSKKLNGSRTICGYYEVSRRTASALAVRIKKILMKLGRSDENYSSVYVIKDPKIFN